MPIIGVFYVILLIALSVHVIRTGRPIYWIFLIVFLQVIGPAIYIIAELVPEYMGSHRGQRAASGLGRALDPGRRYRRFVDAVEEAPTVQNMLHLAEECLALGRYQEAVDLYLRCLDIPLYAEDPAILAGLARAQFGTSDYVGARATLEKLSKLPDYSSPELHLLHARTLEALGEDMAARREYEAVANYFPGPEATCRLALLLRKMGDHERAAAIFTDIKKQLDRSPRHVRRLNREWYDLAAANAR